MKNRSIYGSYTLYKIAYLFKVYGFKAGDVIEYECGDIKFENGIMYKKESTDWYGRILDKDEDHFINPLLEYEVGDFIDGHYGSILNKKIMF